MLFNKKFTVVTVCKGGVVCSTNTTYLKGKRKDINDEIELLKKLSRGYEMFEEGMVVYF